MLWSYQRWYTFQLFLCIGSPYSHRNNTFHKTSKSKNWKQVKGMSRKCMYTTNIMCLQVYVKFQIKNKRTKLVSPFSSSLVQSFDPICVIAFDIEKCSECTFHESYFYFSKPRKWHVLKENLEKTEVWVNLLLNLILY